MDDTTMTELFRRMDEHLARQDAHLTEITATLRQQNLVLDATAHLLVTTAQEVAELHVSAVRGFSGAMHVLSNLINRLDGRSGDA